MVKLIFIAGDNLVILVLTELTTKIALGKMISAVVLARGFYC